MRFHIPGMASINQVSPNDSDDDEKEEGEINVERERLAVGNDGEVITRASLVYDLIKGKVDVGQGDWWR